MPWKNGNPPLYHVWRNMLDRCYSPKVAQYDDYGGRGIKVCPQWRSSYQQWFNDMGPRPKSTSIDRINNDGDYTPKNCKWSTKKEQQRNRRTNVYVTIEGITYFALGLAEKAGLKTDTIVERSKRGLPYEKVISSEKFHNYDPQALKRGAEVSAKRRREKTHCKNGHEFTPKNTRMEGNKKYTWRVCKTCQLDRRRA